MTDPSNNTEVTVTSDEVVGMAKMTLAIRFWGSYADRLTEEDVANALSLERKFNE